MKRQDIDPLLKLPVAELIALADKTRKEFSGEKLDLCSIMNAKSGLCDQDCKFCAQGNSRSSGAKVYPLKGKKEILEAALRAKEIGAERFGIVTSGDSLSNDELRRVCDAVFEITTKLGIRTCASLGTLSEDGFSRLRKAGLSRYHHNLETSERYFPNIVSTHSFSDRVATVCAAKKAGLKVCSGGIIGMGENMGDRVELALKLKELDVDSVPINVLVPIKGTPLGELSTLPPFEAIRTIAIFRIILKDKVIKMAAGRESVLKDFQAMAFLGGANGMLIGGYLTIKGREVDEDRRLVEEVQRLWQI